MRSGTRTYNSRENEFMGKAFNKILSDMSYSQLRAYEYKLWLAAVKDYGSEAKLRAAYKKKGIKGRFAIYIKPTVFNHGNRYLIHHFLRYTSG